MKSILIIVLGLLANGFIQAQNGTMIDPRDGKTYKTIHIGSQNWMAENLYYFTHKDTIVPNVHLKDVSIIYASCYEGRESFCDKYGGLYNWYVAQIACPSGWHLPSVDEYNILLKNIKGSGQKKYFALLEGGNSGFNALLAGEFYTDGILGPKAYISMNTATFFWTSNQKEHRDVAVCFYLTNNSGLNKASVNSNSKVNSLSIRCIQDSRK